ncbi:YrhK family protein [Pectobacteriaceae bacterium CE90]|nr:YrhK family protein [Pectobacteriaceae bacterium CE90]
MLTDRTVFSVAGEHLAIKHRYEALGALNDFFIALWFLVGSVFF